MKITDAQLKQIYTHAAEIYPHECCGFLLGQFADGGFVREVRRATNQNQDRTDRFVISPEEFAKVQMSADDAELEIIGIYHSHPDWPPIPSQTDMESAWEEVFYLITSVHEKMPLNTNAWRLADEGIRRFEFVPLEIVDQNEL
ncbi:M67 family metallopeptidase [Anaerolineales bacterium HSG25]|nr:M67 family metallopeptidase [Anaerolineales bacterium HSG25]